MVTSQAAAASAAACEPSRSSPSRPSPRGALLSREEPDPEIRVHALLAGPHFEQQVAEIAGPLRGQARALSDRSALRARRALDGAHDARDVHPEVLLPGHVE